MAKIVFEDVVKRFGDTLAIDNLSFEIEDGEFLVLVGPSGCGKSTALRMLAGLERITSGHIYIDDRRVDNVAARDRDLAMVFQSYALYPHMSVYDNIAFGLKLHKVGQSEIDRRVREAAGLLGIEPLLRRKPGQLSGGQRQRVALGRAIVREPAAFLLDEPLSNLDAQLRVQTRSEIAKLHQRLHTTFVYVTHDQVEAVTMASRIAVLDRGRLQQLGTPGELYERPANTFVAGFIGSPSMNFFRAAVRQTDAGPELDAGFLNVSTTDGRLSALREVVGREVTLGIRPEHIHDPDFLPRDIEPVLVLTTVDVVEAMGSETYLYLQAGENRFVARVDARSHAQPGESFSAAFDLSQLHAFNAESGVALVHAEPQSDRYVGGKVTTSIAGE